jgi:hypothetical protein
MSSINFYKITSTNTDKVYVGSTNHDINERLKHHEANYQRFKAGKTNYTTSFEILECKDYKIELIENKICESKEERGTVECNYIINTPNTVNKMLPGRTILSWQDNKEQIGEQQRQYRQNNKEQIGEQQRQYYRDNREELNRKHNCPCGGKYTKKHKSIHEKTQKHITYHIHIHIHNN